MQQGVTLATTDRGPVVGDRPTVATRAGARLLPVVAVLGLMVLAGVLIVPGGVRRAIYGDEIRQWRDSIPHSYGKILTWRNTSDHAPLSYLLVKLACDLTGRQGGSWVMRVPSMVCGLMCIPAAFWLGRTVKSDALGVLMAAMAAVDLSLVWQSQQARMYSMLLLIMLLGMVQVVKISDELGRQRWRWVLLGVILGIGMWTHAASIVLAVAIIVLAVVLVRQQKRAGQAGPSGPGSSKPIIISAAIALGIGLLMSSPAIFRLTSMVDRNPIESPNVDSIPEQFKVLARELSGRMDLTALMGILMVVGLVMIARQEPRLRVAAIVMLVVGVVTVLDLFVAAWRRPVHGARYVTTADPSLWVGMGWVILWALSRRQDWRIRSAMVGLLVAFLVGQGYRCTQAQDITGTHQIADEFASAARFLRAHVQAGDQVVCVPQIPLMYREYYKVKVTPNMEPDIRALARARSDKRKTMITGTRRKWAKRTTWVFAVNPPAANERGSPSDPRRFVPMVGGIYGVGVNVSMLPKSKPQHIYIIKVNAKGSWVFDAAGKQLAFTPAPIRPKPATVPTTQKKGGPASTQPAAVPKAAPAAISGSTSSSRPAK